MRLTRLVAGAALIVLASGCASQPEVTVRDLVGDTLDVLQRALSQQTRLLVQDVSVLVGDEPSYDANDDGSGWIVVASCADAASIEAATAVEVAVVPASAGSADLDARIAAGDFATSVACEGLDAR